MKLKKADRHRRIISELRNNITVRISELSKQFGVTTETVRRDIKELSEQGLVDRTYGGAAGSLTREPSIRIREMVMVDERIRIARKACELVEPGDVLMIDSASTTIHFARELAALDMDLKVLTNCISVATTLGENPDIRVILCPGEFNIRENSVFGTETYHFLQRFHASKAFVGAGGITVEGVTEYQSRVSWTKRGMIDRSDRVVLMADHGKFNARRMEIACPLSAVDDLVVDRLPASDLLDALISASVSMHVAHATS